MSNKTLVANFDSAEAKVLFEYVAQHCDELNLAVGDVIVDLQHLEPGWMRGTVQHSGKYGAFPDNFVQIVNKTHSPNENSPKLRNKKTDLKIGQIVVAKENYISQKSEELSLRIGDKIEVISITNSSGLLYSGKLLHSSQFGLFALSMVDIYKDRTQSTISALTDGCHGDNRVETIASENNESVPVLPPRPVKELCKVMFEYRAENSDELTLRENDVITVLSRECRDKGWWKGELNGQVGYFPENYVIVCTNNSLVQSQKPNRPDKPASLKRSKLGPVSNNVSPKYENSKVLNSSAPCPEVDELKMKCARTHDTTATALTQSEQLACCSHEAAQKIRSAVDTQSIPMDDFDCASRSGQLNHITHHRPSRPSGSRRPPSLIISTSVASTVHNAAAQRTDEIDKSPSRDSSAPLLENNLVTSTKSCPSKTPPWMNELQAAQITKRVSRLLQSYEDSDGDTAKSPVPATNNRSDREKHVSSSIESVSKHVAYPRVFEPIMTAQMSSTPPLISANTDQTSSQSHCTCEQKIVELTERITHQNDKFENMLRSTSADYKKQILSLMEELDTEKKLRMGMQVMIERLEKVIKDSAFKL